ncbi:MAG: phosphate signaling complex protein PhoU [Chitinivibrionales bacterium]|nr:phosphate signaling complex protein PhoU [Chitinivibrionales bacterium]MBD3394113.1 phosphate signaling complex protein PhoU [Chitinivibrionales bacterium]
MTILMQKEFEKLKKGILTLSALVEESVNRSVKAVMERNEGLAKSVIESDNEIDSMEIDVEEECLKILALHQPVAADLRFIVAVLKINNDLERVGDLAVNICERALPLTRFPVLKAPFGLPEMGQKVRLMVKKSLDALVNVDEDAAEEVCRMDDDVDNINRDMYAKVTEHLQAKPQDAEALLHLLSISRQLERIGDHATNIAQDVIYLIRGEIIRHQGLDSSSEAQ